MSLSVWDLPVAVRPENEVEPDEFPACRSLLYTDNGSEPGPRVCRVNHGETGEKPHGAWVGGNWSAWDDAMAARSVADFGPRPAAGPMCDACDIRPATGLCRPCFNAQERDENREVIEA